MTTKIPKRSAKPALSLKRVYEPASAGDGHRVLVDRLWPRGISKDEARLDEWLKDLSPSDELRRRFHGHPESWDEFRKAYADELRAEPAKTAAAHLLERAASGPVTLLFAAKDVERNNAVVLAAWLEKRLARKRR